MPATTLARELAAYGPDCAGGKPSLDEARAYCRRYARGHYENFSVASWLLPRALRPHFYAVYAYCRWADDLADETADRTSSLALLDWWQAELDDCYRGRASHPVFVALADTIRQFSIPQEPFARLLVAFRQDQERTSYQTFDELLGYCRSSANPVGELVLYLGRAATPENISLSDRICTGLQLTNFWQDVARDAARGRVYLPQETLRAAGYTAAMLDRREYNRNFREALTVEVDRAENWLRSGWPLVDRVPKELAVDVSLFLAGGLAVLGAIRRIDYNVWQRRPTVSKAHKARLLASAWVRVRLGIGGARS